MIKGIHQSARNMTIKMRNMEIVSQNLANISTTGYKRELPFSELVNRFDDNRVKQVTDFSQGSAVQTGNPLDAAIDGNGFFVVESENGLELTRNGSFRIADDGTLVTVSGAALVGEAGNINLNEIMVEKPTDFNLKENGEIYLGNEYIGKLKIARLLDQNSLMRSESGHFYKPGGNYEYAQEGEYSIQQGYLEDSNVNPILEMQHMITLNKDYEASQRLIREYDSTMSRSNEVGRV